MNISNLTARIALLLFTLFISGCSDHTAEEHEPSPLVLNYSDFGPPQLSEGLLGERQYHWPDPDNHKPTAPNIKVVVYKEGQLELATSTYPVAPEEKIDYRYVGHMVTRAWFDKKIAELEKDLNEGDEENLLMMFPYLQGLYQTQILIEKHF